MVVAFMRLANTLAVLRSMMQLTILGLVERKNFSEMHCSVAQCLEVVGEWWSLLIVRDACLGVTRFDDFQERLGPASSRRASSSRFPTASTRPGTTTA